MDNIIRWTFKYVDPHHIHHHDVCLPKAHRYAKMMEEGDKFPPVQINKWTDGLLMCRDGAHRVMAAKLCGMKLFVKIKE